MSKSDSTTMKWPFDLSESSDITLVPEEEVNKEIDEVFREDCPENPLKVTHCKLYETGHNQFYSTVKIFLKKPFEAFTDEDYLILRGSEVLEGDLMPNENLLRKNCYCCKVTEATAWIPVPWLSDIISYLCNTCYSAYQETGSVCLNDACRHVYKIRERNLLIRKQCDGKAAVRPTFFMCSFCDGCVPIPDNWRGNYHHSRDIIVGVCFICTKRKRMQKSQVPWKPGKIWCFACRGRYYNGRIACVADACRHLPTKKEIDKILRQHNKSDGGSQLKCSKCQGILRDDRHLMPREFSKGRLDTCYSCGFHGKGKWNSLPWDKKGPNFLCTACALRFRKFRSRCLNDACRRIFYKDEFESLANVSQTQFVLGDNQTVSCAPCKLCNGPTMIYPKESRNSSCT